MGWGRMGLMGQDRETLGRTEGRWDGAGWVRTGQNRDGTGWGRVGQYCPPHPAKAIRCLHADTSLTQPS